MIDHLTVFTNLKKENENEIFYEFNNFSSNSGFKEIEIKEYNDKTVLIGYYIYKKLFVLLSFFLVYLLFFLSLEKCYLGIDSCPGKFDWMKLKLKELIISCFILSILIECIFYDIISKLNIAHIVVIFYSFYEYSHGLEFDDHGLFNFIGYFSLLFIILLFFIPFNVLVCIVKKKKKYLLKLYEAAVLLLII